MTCRVCSAALEPEVRRGPRRRVCRECRRTRKNTVDKRACSCSRCSCAIARRRTRWVFPNGRDQRSVLLCEGCFRLTRQRLRQQRARRPRQLRLPWMPVDRLRARRRRASADRLKRLHASGGSQQKGRWQRICERDGWECWVCHGAIDARLTPPHRLAGTADHVVALVDGGTDADDNLRAAHLSCNVRRHRARLTQLAPPAAYQPRGATIAGPDAHRIVRPGPACPARLDAAELNREHLNP